MKVDEPFLIRTKPKETLNGLIFRLAEADDSSALVSLNSQRNPMTPKPKVVEMTKKELIKVKNDENYRLFIASYCNQIIAFCRLLNCAALPEEKVIYPAPRGWYAMGMIVESTFRRRGVAEFLHLNRSSFLRKIGVNRLFSIVDSRNLSSIRMHEHFGFEKLSEAKGFLHVELESGCGYLYRLTI